MYQSSFFRLTKAVVLGYLVSTVCVFLLSWGLYVMKWSWAGSEVTMRMVYGISCLAAGFLAGREFREKRMIWGIFSSILYAIIFLTVSQLTGGLGSSSLLEIFLFFGICIIGGAVGSIFS